MQLHQDLTAAQGQLAALEGELEAELNAAVEAGEQVAQLEQARDQMAADLLRVRGRLAATQAAMVGARRVAQAEEAANALAREQVEWLQGQVATVQAERVEAVATLGAAEIARDAALALAAQRLLETNGVRAQRDILQEANADLQGQIQGLQQAQAVLQVQNQLLNQQIDEMIDDLPQEPAEAPAHNSNLPLSQQPAGVVNAKGSRSLGNGYTVDRLGRVHNLRGHVVRDSISRIILLQAGQGPAPIA